SRIGNWTFWRTVSDENRAPCWNRMPQRRSVARRSRSLAPPKSAPNTSIVPDRLGTRPMMVRISTDLPAPDPPTKPRISPRNTSSDRWSSTVAPLNPTTRSRTRMTASLPACAIALFTDRREEHGEEAVHHDHQEHRLHHRGGGVQAERLGAALHPQPLGAGDEPDHQRHERRLDHADREMIDGDRVFQARDEDFRADAT